MRYLAIASTLAILTACGSGGGGKKSGTTPPPPPPPAVTYHDVTVSDVPGTTTSAAYRPTRVQEGSDGSWKIEFERDGHTLRFDVPTLPDTSWGWTMSRWLVDSSDVVDCIVTNTTASGTANINAHWVLTPVAGG